MASINLRYSGAEQAAFLGALALARLSLEHNKQSRLDEPKLPSAVKHRPLA